MAAADLLVGKAGAPTVCEALASGLPLAIAGPVPGQEERTGTHLLEHGAAIRCNNLPSTVWRVAQLLDEPARLARMRATARVMARSPAAANLAVECLRQLAQPAAPEAVCS